MYNMVFAKNELMFDDIRVSMLLDIFWRLLEFNPDEEPESHIQIQGQNNGLTSEQQRHTLSQPEPHAPSLEKATDKKY